MMSKDECFECYRTIYRVLRTVGEALPALTVPAIASMRLLLVDAVGESEQSRLIALWNDEIEQDKRRQEREDAEAQQTRAHPTMSDDECFERYRTIYRLLDTIGEVLPNMAVPAIASMRLLLIDTVGESEQSRLIGLWNDEIEQDKVREDVEQN